MTARERRRPPKRLQGWLRTRRARQRSRGLFFVEGDGAVADWRILAFSKRDESTEVAKTGGERAGASAEWHAWTEPDHACPDERRDEWTDMDK